MGSKKNCEHAKIALNLGIVSFFDKCFFSIKIREGDKIPRTSMKTKKIISLVPLFVGISISLDDLGLKYKKQECFLSSNMNFFKTFAFSPAQGPLTAPRNKRDIFSSKVQLKMACNDL